MGRLYLIRHSSLKGQLFFPLPYFILRYIIFLFNLLPLFWSLGCKIGFPLKFWRSLFTKEAPCLVQTWKAFSIYIFKGCYRLPTMPFEVVLGNKSLQGDFHTLSSCLTFSFTFRSASWSKRVGRKVKWAGTDTGE